MDHGDSGPGRGNQCHVGQLNYFVKDRAASILFDRIFGGTVKKGEAIVRTVYSASTQKISIQNR
jgi:hypothetical protein